MMAKNFITLKNLLLLLTLLLLQTSSGMVSPQTFGLRLRGEFHFFQDFHKIPNYSNVAARHRRDWFTCEPELKKIHFKNILFAQFFLS